MKRVLGKPVLFPQIIKMNESSHLSSFFCEKSLLITGGTGFLGKCLLEKVLRSCPLVARVYLLIRSKSGQSGQKRVQLLLSESVFDRIRQECPQQLAKVVAISGDVTIDELAMNPIERQLVLENVSIIFNCAATIRFDEPLRRALQLNVGSALRVLRLAQRCPQLQVSPHWLSLPLNSASSGSGSRVDRVLHARQTERVGRSGA